MNKEKIIAFAIRYGITFAIMVVITILLINHFGYSPDAPADDRYLVLADAFTVPAMIAMLFGALLWVSTTGFFDSIGYAVSVAVNIILPIKRNPKIEKYYDYKVRKAEKRFKGYGFLLISGAIYFVIALVFIVGGILLQSFWDDRKKDKQSNVK